MQKSKKCLVMLVVVLLLIPTLIPPSEAAGLPKIPQSHNNLYDSVSQVRIILSRLSNRPFASELFTHFIYGRGDKAYWEEEVPQHIKDEFFCNDEFKEKLHHVMENAYSNGSWKVVYVFGEGTPAYYDPEIFNEAPIIEDSMEFTSHEMEAIVGHINGRLVIGADYLGNNKFEVWTALSDLYDFDFRDCESDSSWLCDANNIAAILQRLNLGRTFNLTIGFTRTYEWTPPTQSVPTTSNMATVQPSAPVTQPQSAGQQSSSSQFYARGNYDIGDYTGDMLQGKPHGYGTLTYSSQTKYEIGMSDGSWFKATKYTGNWANGIRCGQGVFTFANGIQYDGIWNTDGYYFKGYVKSDHFRQYIEQKASGDTITTVYSGPVERIG